MCEEERSGSDFRSSSMLSSLQKSNPEKFQRYNFLISYQYFNYFEPFIVFMAKCPSGIITVMVSL